MILVSNGQEASSAPKYVLFEIHMQNVKGFKAFLVDDEPSREPDVKMVDVFKINVYLIELPLKSLKYSWFGREFWPPFDNNIVQGVCKWCQNP